MDRLNFGPKITQFSGGHHEQPENAPVLAAEVQGWMREAYARIG